MVFFPDPVADVCRFKGLGLCAQQRQVCLCQSYAFASFAHSPSVLLLVAGFVPSQMYWDGIRVQPCVLLVVAIMGLLPFFGCPCILLVFVPSWDDGGCDGGDGSWIMIALGPGHI